MKKKCTEQHHKDIIYNLIIIIIIIIIKYKNASSDKKHGWRTGGATGQEARFTRPAVYIAFQTSQRRVLIRVEGMPHR